MVEFPLSDYRRYLADRGEFYPRSPADDSYDLCAPGHSRAQATARTFMGEAVLLWSLGCLEPSGSLVVLESSSQRLRNRF